MDDPKLPTIPTVHLGPREVEQVKDDSRKPKCPFCGMDPLQIHIDDELNALGGGKYLVTRTTICQKCRCVLPVQVLGVRKSALDPTTSPLPPQIIM